MATSRYNRLALDENNPAQARTDVDTNKSPVFTLGAPYVLSVAHIVDDVVAPISDWASVRLQITSQCNKDGDRYLDKATSSLNPVLTQGQWDAASSAHAAFSLSGLDTGFPLNPCDNGPLYYVLTVTRVDGQIVPLGNGTISIDRAHQSGSGLVLAPSGSSFPLLGLSVVVSEGSLGGEWISLGPNQFQLALTIPVQDFEPAPITFGSTFVTFGDPTVTFGHP